VTDEASKTRAVRGSDFADTYLQGRVIDIGCGPDKIVPHAEPFDLEHGDAQQIASLRPNEAYDAVCSSHCLEHMRDVPAALDQWWALVRRGGYLILVVPDEDLYEQGGWPSLFNRDHKATFRFGKNETWSPVSYDIATLVQALDGAQIVSCERQDRGYDHALRRARLTRFDRILFRAGQLGNSLCRRLGVRSPTLERATIGFFRALGAPVDQTGGAALAQIQIIARKTV
jgi:SAM-dependent methyltransferase